jgi:hypothetical protein
MDGGCGVSLEGLVATLGRFQLCRGIILDFDLNIIIVIVGVDVVRAFHLEHTQNLITQHPELLHYVKFELLTFH